mmetsp:Transcript_5934/g.12982  ORF Transcript_5934/g.12982 Transcript_5934/m.12982 type:complete len:597 (-) Transcript_5934:183-1973(-)
MTSSIGFDRLQDNQQALLLALLSTGVTRTELTDALQSGTDQEWHERLNRHDVRRGASSPKNLRILAAASGGGASSLTAGGIARGAEVVLSGERNGKKRRYNGCLATVVRYPRAGGWMTVRPLHTAAACTHSTSDTSSTGSAIDLCGAGDIKWRKGGCTSIDKVETKQLSLLGLSDNSLSHIVGYIGHGVPSDGEQQQQQEDSDSDEDTSTGTNGLLWLVDAARLHRQIASVCRRLMQFATNNMRDSFGYIDANFDGLREEQIAPCVLWMCKYRLRLGTLRMRIELADVPLMCQFLQQCDTEKVTYVQARIDGHGSLWKMKDTITNSSLIRRAWVAKFCRDSEVVNLAGGDAHPRLDRMAADLDVPYRYTSWKELHDTIAEQCPNVSHLKISVKVPINEDTRDYWRSHHFSPALFSMGTIRTLELSCNFCTEGMIPSSDSVKLDSCFVDAYISGLHNLDSLDLGFSSSLAEGVYGRRYHIQSPSLRALNVERLSKHMWVSCNCPKLEQFVCNGSGYGNGSRPVRATREQMASDVIRTGTVNMVGLEVPDGCKCVLVGFRRDDWSQPDEWDVSVDMPDLLTAHFWTYSDTSAADQTNT